METNDLSNPETGVVSDANLVCCKVSGWIPGLSVELAAMLSLNGQLKGLNTGVCAQ